MSPAARNVAAHAARMYFLAHGEHIDGARSAAATVVTDRIGPLADDQWPELARIVDTVHGEEYASC